MAMRVGNENYNFCYSTQALRGAGVSPAVSETGHRAQERRRDAGATGSCRNFSSTHTAVKWLLERSEEQVPRRVHQCVHDGGGEDAGCFSPCAAVENSRDGC